MDVIIFEKPDDVLGRGLRVTVEPRFLRHVSEGKLASPFPFFSLETWQKLPRSVSSYDRLPSTPGVGQTLRGRPWVLARCPMPLGTKLDPIDILHVVRESEFRARSHHRRRPVVRLRNCELLIIQACANLAGSTGPAPPLRRCVCPGRSRQGSIARLSEDTQRSGSRDFHTPKGGLGDGHSVAPRLSISGLPER